MSGKPVVFHEEAAADYEAAADWYFQRSPLAASKFSAEVSIAIETIAKAPHRWPVSDHGARKFVLHRFPFSIIDRELPSSVQVLAVAHGRRLNYRKSRLR